MAYNNKEEGGRFPENEEIFREIDRVAAPLAEGKRKEPQGGDETNAPSCHWSPEKK